MVKQAAKQNVVANEVLEKVKHVSLLWVAFGCCVLGGSGLVWLWWRWRGNYVWLINKIFMYGAIIPWFARFLADKSGDFRVVALNSLAGLISTLISVYSQHGGKFSITARITVIAAGSCTIVTAILFLLYNNWILEDVKRDHHRESGTNSIAH